MLEETHKSEEKVLEKKPQDINGLELPNYQIKSNLLIKICQHLLIVIVIHISIWYIARYLCTKPLFTAAVPQF